MNDELNVAKIRSQVRREKNRRRRKRKNEFKTPPKKWDIPLTWKGLFLTCFAIWCAQMIAVNVINNHKLAVYGENTVAYVYKKTQNRGNIWRSYYFEVNGTLYRGRSNEDWVKVGDSIMIVYLQSDPSVNNSYTRIKRQRERFQGRQERRNERARRKCIK